MVDHLLYVCKEDFLASLAGGDGQAASQTVVSSPSSDRETGLPPEREPVE